MTKTNATVTVTYGGKSVTIELAGTELSGPHDDSGHRYLNTASRDHVASEVERALLSLTDDDERVACALCGALVEGEGYAYEHDEDEVYTLCAACNALN